MELEAISWKFGAGLFAKGGGKDIVVGVVICVVFPAMMVAFSAWFVARNIFEDKRRRAAWVVEGDPELEKKVCHQQICYRLHALNHVSLFFFTLFLQWEQIRWC